MTSDVFAHLRLYWGLGLTSIPLKPRSKEPLVKWGDGWNPSREELKQWVSKPAINWGVRCGCELAALDFDTLEALHNFLQAHPEVTPEDLGEVIEVVRIRKKPPPKPAMKGEQP